MLTHVYNAHTDGDTWVFFADANVLATGDIVVLGRFPNIDVANRENINGMMAGADAYSKTWAPVPSSATTRGCTRKEA